MDDNQNLNNNQPYNNSINTGVNNSPESQGINLTNDLTNQANNTPSLNEMNIDGTYNKMNAAPSYVNDAQVRENIGLTKKTTVPVTNELKTIILIAIVLLIFIIIMPYIFDLVNKIKFH